MLAKGICFYKFVRGVVLPYYIYTTCFPGLVDALEEYHVEAICCDGQESITESHFNNSCIRVESCFDTVSYNVDGGNIKVNCTFGGLFFCNDGDKLRGCTLVINSDSQISIYDECLRLFHKLFKLHIQKDKLDCLSALCERYKSNSICSAHGHNDTYTPNANVSLVGFKSCTKARECELEGNALTWKIVVIVLVLVVLICVVLVICFFYRKRRDKRPKDNEESSTDPLSSKTSTEVKYETQEGITIPFQKTHPVESAG